MTYRNPKTAPGEKPCIYRTCARASILQKHNPKNTSKGDAMRKIAMLAGLLICLAILNAILARAEAGQLKPRHELQAKVTAVHDGDTFWAEIKTPLCGWVLRKVRLTGGVDCPEAKQPWGKEASARTAQLVLGKEVLLVVAGQSWGRPVCQVILPDGRDLGRLLVAEGHAWADRRYTKGPELPRLQAEAKAARRGLWQAKNPIEPRKWRKGER